MGAMQFACFSLSKKSNADNRFVRFTDAQAAFDHQYNEAEEAHGNSGYTGTIAEKEGFEVVQTETRPQEELDAALTLWGHLELGKLGIAPNENNDAANDKWGPAACIEIKTTDGRVYGWYFFGWASS